MLTLVVLALLGCWCSCAGHEWSLTCSGDGQENLRFEPAGGATSARYKLHWCSHPPSPLLQSWALNLYILDEPEYAERCPPRLGLKNKDIMHSKFEQIINQTVDCQVVCLSTHLDLVYRGCYQARLALRGGAAGGALRSLKQLIYVNNTYSLEEFNNHETWFTATSVRDTVQITIFNKFVPLEDYFVQMCNENECWDIGSTCTPLSVGPGSLDGLGAVRCKSESRHGRNMRVLLSHGAPWVHGAVFAPNIMDITFNFTHDSEFVPGVVGRSGTEGGGDLAGAVAAGVVCAGAALGLLLWWRRRPTSRWRENVAKAWKERCSTGMPAEVGKPLEAALSRPLTAEKAILLLYARDASPFMRAMAALRDVLEVVAPGQVYDLHSPRTVVLAAASPNAWLRGMLASGARVVLVQALPAAIYAASLDGDRVVSALLPSRAQYRSPQFGDTLLQFALRLLHDMAHEAPYKQIYVCSLSELPAESMAQVVPFRRYQLPDALAVLLRDLSGSGSELPPLPPEAAEVTAALSEHAALVRSRPNYLQDDLLMIL